MALTTKPPGAVSVPNDLTEQATGALGVPVNLAEEPTTNYALYSEDYTNAVWTKTAVSEFIYSGRKPISANAYIITENTAAGNHQIVQNVTNNGFPSDLVFSAYVKANGRNWVFLGLTGIGYWFDISNGVVGTGVGSPDQANIVDAGNGWYRISITSYVDGSPWHLHGISLGDADNSSIYTGDGSSGIIVTGVQVEKGHRFPTSYLATTSASATEGFIAIPNNLTEQSAGSVAIPNNLTEQASGSPAIPNNLTEQSAGSVAIPNNLTEQAEGSVAIPVNLTEQGAGAVSIPNNLTEQAVGSPAIPNNLTELAEATMLRSLNPVFKLDFANGVYEDLHSHSLTDIVTYARNSNASFWNRRVNEQGRYEYFLDTDVVGSVTNLLTYSEQFDNAAWGKDQIVILSDFAISPNGDKTADKMIATSANIYHGIRQDISVISGTRYTFTIYVKKSEYGYVQLTPSTGFDASQYVNFDLDNGAVTRKSMTSGDGYYSSEYVGDGWYRCMLSVVATSTTNGRFLSIVGQTGQETRAASWAGDDVSGILIWGAQITASAKSLPYVATTTTSASETFVEQPRIEYDPATGECLGYLHEQSSTNILLRSEEFTNASWTKSVVTAAASSGIAPDGTNSMTLITQTGANGSVRQNWTSATSTNYAVSIYAKTLDSDNSMFGFFDVTGGDWQGRMNIVWTGGVPSAGGILGTVNDPTFQDCGNGIWRISFWTTSDAVNTTSQIYFYPDTNNLSRSVYLWGAQLEALPYASSYIRTEGSTVTRNSDAMTASPVASNSNTMYVNARVNAVNPSANQYIFSAGTDNNNISAILAQSINGRFRPFCQFGGVTQYDLNDANYIFSDGFVKGVITQSLNNVITYGNGSQSNTDTAAIIPEITTVRLGANLNNTSIMTGHIKEVMIFDNYLTAPEVARIETIEGITEAVSGEVSIPNNITEVSAGAVSIPNNLAESAVSAFPRTFNPKLSLNFVDQLYAVNDNGYNDVTDSFDYSRNSTASYWSRYRAENRKYVTYIKDDYVGTVTNLTHYSEDLTQWAFAFMTAELVTVSDDPLGNGIVSKITDDNGLATHTVTANTATVSSGAVVTHSAYLKAASDNQLADYVMIYDVGAADGMYFDLVNGRIGDSFGSGRDGFMYHVGNGWYHCGFTCTVPATQATLRIYMETDTQTPSSYTGNFDSVYVTGAMTVESGRILPYVKTPTNASASDTFTETLRIEYDPLTAEPRGYLSESTVTNLQISSHEMDSTLSAYGATRSSLSPVEVIADGFLSPEGRTRVGLFQEDSTASNSHYMGFQSLTWTGSTKYCFSIYVKAYGKNTQRYFCLWATSSANIFPTNAFVVFDLVNGTYSGNGNEYNAGMQDCGNGWYRCFIVHETVASPTNPNRGFYMAINETYNNAGAESFNGNGESGFYVWGAQIEEGASFPTSLIYTDTATATRSPDELYKINYLANRGTFICEYDYGYRGNELNFDANINYIAEFSDNSTSDRWLMYNISGNARGMFIISEDVNYTTRGQTDEVPLNDKVYKAGFICETNHAAIYDGLTGDLIETIDTTAKPPQALGAYRLCIGCRYNGSSQLDGYIRRIVFIPDVLTGTEIRQQ